MRLDKYICKSTGLSRMEATHAIKNKQVTVNQVIIVKKDYDVNSDQDTVRLSDKELVYLENIYLMMNKPAGYVSATTDNHQKTVFDLIHDLPKSDLFIVGRLDIDSTGLLLITNDGGLAHQFMNPKHHVQKIYEVTYTKELTPVEIELFQTGIPINDGKQETYITKPAKIVVVKEHRCQATVTLWEGKFHQVKRMFAYFDSTVTSLKRTQIGTLRLDPSLVEGQYRLLYKEEIEQLKLSVK
jgi:16S rRNA pseudouridine516 synthase